MEKTITLRIPEDMKKTLDKICEQEGKNISLVIRDALRRLISVHRFKDLRKKTIPYAEKSGILYDEDIFDIAS